jgi:hypothetical protein
MGVYVAASTDKIRVTTGSATAGISIQGSYVQANASTGAFTGCGPILFAPTTATDTDILAGPGSSDFRTLKECTIRNTDTAVACDVTVSFNNNSVIYSKYKVTLNPGDVLEYAEGAGWIYLPFSTSYLDRLLFVKGSDVVNTTTSFADITGLTCPVKAGVRYAVHGVLHVISAATTTGIQVGYNLPNGAPTSAEFTARQVVTNSATASTDSTGEASARDTAIIVQTTGPAAIGPAEIYGGFVPSADDTFALRLKSEVAASGVTVKINSWLRISQEH